MVKIASFWRENSNISKISISKKKKKKVEFASFWRENSNISKMTIFKKQIFDEDKVPRFLLLYFHLLLQYPASPFPFLFQSFWNVLWL